MTVSPETHLRAFFATETFDKSSDLKLGHEEAEHYRGLWEDIASQLQCSVKDIVDFDLCFADSQPAEVIVSLFLTKRVFTGNSSQEQD